MSQENERTVLVARKITCSSNKCSIKCKYLYVYLTGGHCELAEGKPRRLLEYEDGYLRTPFCIEAECAARGGVI